MHYFPTLPIPIPLHARGCMAGIGICGGCVIIHFVGETGDDTLCLSVCPGNGDFYRPAAARIWQDLDKHTQWWLRPSQCYHRHSTPPTMRTLMGQHNTPLPSAWVGPSLSQFPVIILFSLIPSLSQLFYSQAMSPFQCDSMHSLPSTFNAICCGLVNSTFVHF